jgi:hypothetical protein
MLNQLQQLKNPDSVIALTELTEGPLLGNYAVGLAGIMNGDSLRFERQFWEQPIDPLVWQFELSSVTEQKSYGGREKVVLWEQGRGQLRAYAAEVKERLHDADRRGNAAWGRKAVAVSQMRSLPATLYSGEKFDTNVAIILPREEEHLPAIWTFCSSDEFAPEVRKVTQKLSVTNATLVKVPFNLEHWQAVAKELYPNGLPEPFSDDPTQWLFHGDPMYATRPLQVAVARLCGYRWPEETCDAQDAKGGRESRKITEAVSRLYGLEDDDGIVPLHATRADDRDEPSASDRLRAMLREAYLGEPPDEQALLRAEGAKSASLELWLRDEFFASHCALFHQRPFIWHVWDGRKDGFHALLNYHPLTRNVLQKVCYTHLGSWIERQRQSGNAPGAEDRLAAAVALQRKLEAIIEGEPPYDIFVRWKPLNKQPLGWEPDLDDGVRMNIRPFATAEVLRAKVNVKWDKDRGKNPDGSKRLNDLHFTRAEKIAARERNQ